MDRPTDNRTVMTQSAQARARHRFTGDMRGVSAVEFALIVPLILLIFFAMVEVSQGLNANRKLTLTVRALSDLVAQATSVTSTDVNNVFAAASSIMQPFSTVNLKSRISAINIDASGVTKVDWSRGSGMSARAKGDVVTIPAGLRIAGTQLIWSEAEYLFTPPVGYFLTGPITMKDQFFARPRQSNTVAGPTS
ncbi:MAG: TadE/TadG family type IV pilus assembly protein [Xanthobacteraceae bacterium]